MARLQLVIANKNYSSWSMRAWVLLRELGIDFEEVPLEFSPEISVIGIERYSAVGKVPVLIVEGDPVWDSLAICETVAELFPDKRVWPSGKRARQVARSVCAEMHSGFQAMRHSMPMNVRGRHPGKGMNPDTKRDIDRVVSIWRECRGNFGADGDLLFGGFSAADAYFVPVAMRFATYAVGLPPVAQAYAESLRALRSVREWTEAAKLETAFIAAEEPYATP
jgi:glutathione S-transferase